MASSKQPLVTGKDGWRGVLTVIAHPEQTIKPQTLIQLENGEQLVVPTELLVQQPDGNFYLALSLVELKQQTGSELIAAAEKLIIPVIVEELEVHKRQVVSGGVCIHKTVHEHIEVVAEPLLRENVEVERIAINQVVDSAPQIRYEGDKIIIPLLEEVLVVEKRLMLKEEIHITRRQTTFTQPQSVLLRSEEIEVEQLSPASQAAQTSTNEQVS